MKNATPSKVYASIVSKNRNTSQASAFAGTNESNKWTNEMFAPSTNLIGTSSTARQSDRMITVTAVGEVSLPPDRCRVTVNIHSEKDNVQDVKNSIQRRLDYVLQTFQNHNVKESDMKIHKFMQRKDTMYHMNAEVVVIFMDFQKSQTSCNLLVEKLDETVTVGPPQFYHAGSTLETLRQQASLLAVHNAKQKAQEIAQFVHQSVGRPITIQEEESKEWEGQVEGVADLDSMATIQQRIAQATVTVSCRVNMTFELKPKSKNKSGN